MSELRALLTNEAKTAEVWKNSASGFLAQGKTAAAILATARAVGQGIPKASLELLIPPSTAKNTQVFDAKVKAMKSRDESPEKIVQYLLDGVLSGGDASYLLRSMAQTLDQAYQSTVALDLIRASLAIMPKDHQWYADTHALVLMSLGRFDEAKKVIDKLAKIDRMQAKWLRAYLVGLTAPFEFWPMQVYGENDPDPEAETSPLELGQAKSAIETSANRIGALREPLAKHGTKLPKIQISGRGKSDDYSFSDKVGSLPNLLWETRKEWARLCWMLAGIGMSTLQMPKKIQKPHESLEFIDTVYSVRFNVVSQLDAGKKPKLKDDLDRDAMKAEWCGLPLGEFTSPLTKIYLDEMSAVLAAIRWARGIIGSPFEDQ